MKKAILFPGTGYTCKEDLFQRIKKELISCGYQVFSIDYSPIPFKPIKTVKEAVDIALGFSICSLQKENITDEDELLFVSKSIGCIVALKFSSLLNLKAKHILLTPTEDALKEVSEYSDIASAVIGDSDPLMDVSTLKEFCSNKEIPMLIVQGTGHSLKTDNPKETEEKTLEIVSFLFSAK